MHGSGAVSCSCSLLIRGPILPAVRQKLHLSPCADSRSRLYVCREWNGDLNEKYFEKNPAILGQLRRIFEKDWNKAIEQLTRSCSRQTVSLHSPVIGHT